MTNTKITKFDVIHIGVMALVFLVLLILMGFNLPFFIVIAILSVFDVIFILIRQGKHTQ